MGFDHQQQGILRTMLRAQKMAHVGMIPTSSEVVLIFLRIQRLAPHKQNHGRVYGIRVSCVKSCFHIVHDKKN